MFKFIQSFLILFSLALVACSSGPAPVRPLEITVPQDAQLYITHPNQPWVLLPSYQKFMLSQYRMHYFAPWNKTSDPRHFNLPGDALNIKSYEQYQLNTFSQHHFWNKNYKRYPAGWTQSIATNVALARFPNTNKPAIALQNTALRLLPSAQSVYENPDRAGQGYPFDDLQVDNVWAGTPLRIVQISQDGLWALVKAPAMLGWVARANIAPVTQAIMHAWQAHPWVGATQDNVAVKTPQGLIFEAKIGAPYPLVAITKSSYKILVPALSKNGNAILKTAFLPRKFSAQLPLPGTKANFSNMLNHLQGQPYLWGGLKEGRDCSATIRDLLASFGVWMPRSSGDQIATGRAIALKSLSPIEKQQFIARNAVPFATLIGYPGHVTLFVGNHQGVPYIFQNAWGLKTYTLFGQEGRAVIGHTVISPINLGSDEFLTKSLLTKPLTMTYIVPPLSAQALKPGL